MSEETQHPTSLRANIRIPNLGRYETIVTLVEDPARLYVRSLNHDLADLSEEAQSLLTHILGLDARMKALEQTSHAGQVAAAVPSPAFELVEVYLLPEVFQDVWRAAPSYMRDPSKPNTLINWDRGLKFYTDISAVTDEKRILDFFAEVGFSGLDDCWKIQPMADAGVQS